MNNLFWLSLLLTVPCIFVGMYKASNDKGLRGVLWVLLSIVSLTTVWATLAHLLVPGFFSGSFN
jgi:hypothetical protein